jgi:hypothetical protein
VRRRVRTLEPHQSKATNRNSRSKVASGNPRRCRWAILLWPFRPRTGMHPKRLRSTVDLHRCTVVGNLLRECQTVPKSAIRNWASTARRGICKSNINQWIGDEACGSQRFKSLAHQWPQNRHSGMEVLFTMFRERTVSCQLSVDLRKRVG